MGDEYFENVDDIFGDDLDEEDSGLESFFSASTVYQNLIENSSDGQEIASNGTNRLPTGRLTKLKRLFIGVVIFMIIALIILYFSYHF